MSFPARLVNKLFGTRVGGHFRFRNGFYQTVTITSKTYTRRCTSDEEADDSRPRSWSLRRFQTVLQYTAACSSRRVIPILVFMHSLVPDWTSASIAVNQPLSVLLEFHAAN
jgi:hypothetical protein